MINKIKKIIAMYSTLPKKVKLLNVWLDGYKQNLDALYKRMNAVEELTQQHLEWHVESSKPIDLEEYAGVEQIGPNQFIWKGDKNEGDC